MEAPSRLTWVPFLAGVLNGFVGILLFPSYLPAPLIPNLYPLKIELSLPFLCPPPAVFAHDPARQIDPLEDS